MKRIVLPALVVIAAATTGCSTQTFYINGDGENLPEKELMQPFFVRGIGQTQELNAAEICGGAERVARVEAQQRFIDVFLGVVTWGIFDPRTARVYCTEVD